MEATKNLQIEELRGEVDAAAKARQESSAAVEKSIARVKELDLRVAAAGQQLAEANSKHGIEVSQLKARIAALEPLEAQVAGHGTELAARAAELSEKDSQLTIWQHRFEGVVRDKDRAAAGVQQEVAEHKSRLAAMGLTLAAAASAKESLAEQIAIHQQALAQAGAGHEETLADLRSKLSFVIQEKDLLQGEHDKLVARHAEKDTQLADAQAKLAAATEERDALHGHHQQALLAVADKEDVLGALRASLGDIVAEKEALHSQLAERTQTLAAVQAAGGADLQGKVAELNSLLSQRDEQLRSFDQRMRGATAEKDTIIGKLRSMVAQIEPLRQELQQKEQAMEHMQTRISAMAAAPRPLAEVPDATVAEELQETQRQLHATLALQASLKSALEGKDAEIAALTAKAASERKPAAAAPELEEAQRELLVGLASQASLKAVLEGKDAEIAALTAKASAGQSNEERSKFLESQVIDVTGRHAAAQSEMDSLGAEKAALETRLRDKASEHEAALASVGAKQAELDKARAELASLDTRTMTAFDLLKARVAGLEKALDEELPREAALQQTIQTQAAEMAELRAQIAHRDERLAEGAMLQSQVIDVTGRHAAAQSEMESLGAGKADLEAKLREKSGELEAAANAVAAKQAELDKARAELASLDTRTMTAFDLLKARLGELEKALDEVVPREADLRQTIGTQEAALAELRAGIAQRDEQLAGKAMLEEQVIHLSGQHAAAQAALHETTTRFAELSSQIGEQSSAQGAAERSADSKQAELDKAHAEVADLDSKLMTALQAPPSDGVANDEKLAMLENQILDVTGRHAAAKSELDDWSTRYEALAAQARQISAEREAAWQSVKAKQAELDKARGEVTQLDSKLMTIPALEGELTELKAQLVDRDERLEAWESRFHASVGELRGEIEDLTVRLAQPAAMAAAAGFGVGGGSSSPATRADDAQRLREMLASFSLHGVQFLPSSAELIPQSLPILKQAADALYGFPDASVEIAGHTDSWGMPDENLLLSQQRAGAVKEYLINCGIAAWRLRDAGYGHTRPIDSNDTADGRFRNRRIEFHVQ